MAVVNQFIQDDVSLLYTAFFGRAPDATGYTYWVQQMAATPGTSTQSGAADASQALAKSFALVPEFATTYGSLTPSEQIDTLYTNILNRPADAAGKAYWLNEMNNGTAFSTIAWQVVYACFLGGDTVDPADAALVQNKVAVSEYFAGTLHSNNITLAESAFLTVTSDPATVTSTEAALLVASANQITLTPLVETYYGASGNNTFNAMGYVNSLGVTVQTIQDGDSLIGSVNGTNTLNANLISTGVTVNALTNIQQIVLTNGAGTTFDLTNGASVNSVTLNALQNNLSINNAQSSGIAYAVNNTTATGGVKKVVGVSLSTAAADGADDVAALTVNSSSINLNLNSGYESLTVASVGSNTVSTNFAGDVTVSGAGNFVLAGSAGAAVLTTDIDTTALTGTFQATLAGTDTVFVGGNGNTTLTNGAGANDITLGNGANSLNTLIGQLDNDTVIGGTGANTLALLENTIDVGGTTAETAFANVSNFDTLILGVTGGTNSLTIGTNFVDAGFTSINGSLTNDLIVASNVALTDLTFLGGGGTDTFTFNNTASGTITVNQVATVNSGNAAGVASQVVNIAGVTSSTTVDLGAGTDTVNILSDGRASVTVSGVEIVNSGASITGNTVILGNDSTVVTINGGSGDLTVDAATNIASGTAANSYVFGDAENTLQIRNLATVSNAATVSGGSGVDTLELTAQVVGGADGNYATISGFEALALSSAGTNSLTVGTNFVAGGFTEITGSASNDLVIASNVALTDLTFTGGGGTDTFQFSNTASGTVTIDGIDVVSLGDNPGVANNTVNITDVAGSINVELGNGTDTVNIGDTSGTVSVTVSGVEFVNSGASTTSNTVVLANDSTVVTITGGSGDLTVDAATNIASGTAANSYVFGDAENTLQIRNLATVSNAATVSGGSGVDTLELTAQVVGGADGNYATISGFEALALSSAGTNSLTVGTNFVAGGFTEITGSASNDLVIASNVALSGLTFNGGAADDTLTLNTASGTVTINAVEVVTSSGSSDINLSVANGTTVASALVDLGGGTDSLINLNTAGLTVTLSGAETYLGSIGIDTVTLGSGAAISINGGGGTDAVTLSVNTSNVTVLAGSGAAMTVTGSLAATNDSLAISGAGTYNLTSVETVTVGGGDAASTVNSWLFATAATSGGTAGGNTLFTYNLSNNDAAAFTMANNGVTGGSVLLTVNAGDNATISLTGALAAGQTADSLIVTQDVGYTSITLGTSSDAVQTNLGGLSIGTSTADSFVAANFGGAGSDTIDLTGATLTSGLGVGTVLHTTYLNASGFQNTDTFTLNTTFVTGNSTTLANISQTSGANQNAVIFNFGMGSTTADFTTQAGINTAVTYITGNIGITTSGSQSAVMAVADGNGHNALFLFQDDGTSGIDASDLKLIGVVTGSVSASTFS